MTATSWRRRRNSPADAPFGRPARCGRRQGRRSNAGSSPAAPARGRLPTPPTAARAIATTRPPAMPGCCRAGTRGNGRTRSPAGPPARTACGNRRPPGSAQFRRRCPSVPDVRKSASADTPVRTPAPRTAQAPPRAWPSRQTRPGARCAGVPRYQVGWRVAAAAIAPRSDAGRRYARPAAGRRVAGASRRPSAPPAPPSDSTRV